MWALPSKRLSRFLHGAEASVCLPFFSSAVWVGVRFSVHFAWEVGGWCNCIFAWGTTMTLKGVSWEMESLGIRLGKQGLENGWYASQGVREQYYRFLHRYFVGGKQNTSKYTDSKGPTQLSKIRQNTVISELKDKTHAIFLNDITEVLVNFILHFFRINCLSVLQYGSRVWATSILFLL